MTTEACVATHGVVGFNVGGRGCEGGDDHRGTRDLVQLGHHASGMRDVMDAVQQQGRFNAQMLADNGAAIERVNAAVNLNVEKNAAAVNLAIEKTAAAAQLAIEKTAAAATLANAECCCEIKELIKEEACRTRELVNALETSRLKDELADAKQEILLAKLEAKK